MYELLVLSLLMHWPLYGYLIISISNNIIGPEERMSSGTLSTLLSKLERAGLITPADPESVSFPTDRPTRAFAITPAGREHFMQLMLDITSHPGIYHRIFHIKALHLEFLPIEQQIFLVEHYVTYCQQFLRAKQETELAFAKLPLYQAHTSSALRDAALAFMHLKTAQWQLELAWGESLRDHILSRLKQSG